MTTSQLRFQDYGDDGDVAGARRGRRAFRLCVLSLVSLTIFAYIAERFMRYGQAESNFLSGITLAKDSGRVLLKSAIKLDAESAQTPTAKYTQALAVREEDDAALEVYERAFEMDPNNSFFAIRYGCRLFVLGQPAEALEKFQHASSLPPGNALPRYLEAAAAARATRGEAGLREAMVLLARANNTRDPLSFPKPIWFSGYPPTGSQYAMLAREIYAEGTAPLFTLVQQTLRAIESDPDLHQSQYAKTWLDQIVTMGARLVNDAEPRGSLQAIAGVSFQLQAMGLLEKLRTAAGEDPGESLKPIIERQVKLRQALEMLNQFETSRDAQVAAVTQSYQRPLALAALALGAFVACYLLARVLHFILRYQKTAWALEHSTLGKAVLGFGPASLLGLLAAMSVLQHLPAGQQWLLGALSTAWWSVAAVVAGFGPIYPALRLASPEDVSKRSGRLEDMPEVVRLARLAYRRVYAAFIVRYYGILCGVYMGTLCVWVLGYRIAYGLYPTQVNLLASGLIRQEQEVVRSVIALFS